ncbi:MAG: hypothetical protein OFPI_41650 [Osedax symbiont Rs2]|nr:MAG: hypothetical protein OFPI_41650 [Osedax symbiont Rs2]
MIHLDHIVLNVTEVKRSVDFYQKLLSASVENWQAYKKGEVKFPSIRVSDTFIIDMFPPAMWRDQGSDNSTKNNINHFCFAVAIDQWQAIYESLQQQGIEIIRGPGVYWGARGDATAIYINDPDGNVVEIRKYDQ